MPLNDEQMGRFEALGNLPSLSDADMAEFEELDRLASAPEAPAPLTIAPSGDLDARPVQEAPRPTTMDVVGQGLSDLGAAAKETLKEFKPKVGGGLVPESDKLGKGAFATISQPGARGQVFRFGGKGDQPGQTTISFNEHKLTIQDPTALEMGLIAPAALNVLQQIGRQVIPTLQEEIGKPTTEAPRKLVTDAMRKAGFPKAANVADLLHGTATQWLSGPATLDDMDERTKREAVADMEAFYGHPLVNAMLPAPFKDPVVMSAATQALSEQGGKLPLFLIGGGRVLEAAQAAKGTAALAGTSLASGLANVAATLPEVGDIDKTGVRAPAPTSMEAFAMGAALPVGLAGLGKAAKAVFIGIPEKLASSMLDDITGRIFRNVGEELRTSASRVAEAQVALEGAVKAAQPPPGRRVDLAKEPNWKPTVARLDVLDGELIGIAANLRIDGSMSYTSISIKNEKDIAAFRKLADSNGLDILSSQRAVFEHNSVVRALEGKKTPKEPTRFVSIEAGTPPQRPSAKAAERSAPTVAIVAPDGTVTIDRLTSPGSRLRALKNRGAGVVEVTLPTGDKRLAILGSDTEVSHSQKLGDKPVEGVSTYKLLLPFEREEGIPNAISKPMRAGEGMKVRALTEAELSDLAAKQPKRVADAKRRAAGRPKTVVESTIESRPAASYQQLFEMFEEFIERRMAKDPEGTWNELEGMYATKFIMWFKSFSAKEKRKIIGSMKGEDAVQAMSLARLEAQRRGVNLMEPKEVRKLSEEDRQFIRMKVSREFGLDDDELVTLLFNDLYRKYTGATERTAKKQGTFTDIRTAKVSPGTGVFQPPKTIASSQEELTRRFADQKFADFTVRIEAAKAELARQKAAAEEMAKQKAAGTPILTGRVVNVPRVPAQETVVRTTKTIPGEPRPLPDMLPPARGPQHTPAPEGPVEFWQRLAGQRGSAMFDDMATAQHADGSIVIVRSWSETTGNAVFEYPDGQLVAGHARDIVGPASRPDLFATLKVGSIEDVERAVGEALVMYGDDLDMLVDAKGAIYRAARQAGLPDRFVAEAVSKVERGDLTALRERGPTGQLPPPPVRPPEPTGMPPADPPTPPPPHGIPSGMAGEVEVLAKTPALWQLRHALWGATSTGAHDLAQMAAIAHSRKNLQAGAQSDVFRRLESFFGKDPEGVKLVKDYFVANKKNAAQTLDRLKQKYPTLKRDAFEYLTELRTRRDEMDAELRSLGYLPPQQGALSDLAKLSDDELEDYANRTFLRFLLPEGAWAKLLESDKKKWDRLTAELLNPKNGYMPDYVITATPDQKQEWARGVLMDVAGAYDQAHRGQGSPQMGAAAKALRARKDLSPTIREALGETEDGLVVTAATLGKQKANVVNARMNAEIAKRSDWFLPADRLVTGRSNWVKVPSDQPTIFGPLSGGYMRPDVYDAVVKAPEQTEVGHAILRELASWVKGNQVVLGGPSSWVNNVMGNFTNTALAGGFDPFSRDAAGVRAIFETISDFAAHRQAPMSNDSKAKLVERARELGVDAPGWATVEIGPVQDALQRRMQQAIKAANGIESMTMMDVLRVFKSTFTLYRTAQNKLGAAYDLIDRVFKYGNWRALRTRGLANPEEFLGAQFRAGLSEAKLTDLVEREAARRVHESFPMPDRISPWKRKLRSVTPFLGNNYLTYAMEQARVYSRIPFRLEEEGFGPRILFLGLLYEGFRETFKEMRRANGISDEAVEASIASMSESAQAYRPSMAALWYRDANGLPVFHDFSAWIEFTNYLRGNPEADEYQRILYNLAKMPVSGGLLEPGVDRMAKGFGLDLAGPQFSAEPKPWQTTTAATLDLAFKTGLLPGLPDRIGRALGGSVVGQPSRFANALTPPHAVANAFGARFVPAGSPTQAARSTSAQVTEAAMNLRSGALLNNEQFLGAVQFWMSQGKTQQEAIRLATQALIETLEKAKKHEVINRGAEPQGVQR